MRSVAEISRSASICALQPRVEVAPAPLLSTTDRIHNVYAALLYALPLTEAHTDNLLARGLSDTAIAAAGYASLPSRATANALTVWLAKRFDLHGVPGFWHEPDDSEDAYVQGDWRLNVSDARGGFLVPACDLAGRIQGLQIRFDEGAPKYIWLSSKGKPDGTTSGTPIHFAAPHRLSSGRVILTEGPLKAEIIAHYADAPVVAFAGVNCVKPGVGAMLRALGVRKAQIAFDADWQTNRHVSAALSRLSRWLQSAGLTVTVLNWPAAQGKGYDDFLAQRGVR